jgi:hypothetical protein
VAAPGFGVATVPRMSGVARTVPFVSVTAVVLMLLTACGPANGGDVNPRAYAKSVCSGLVTWREGIAGDSAELSRVLGSRSTDSETVKARHTRFFAVSVRRTDELLSVVREAGAPEVENGLGYARDLTDALTRTRRGLAGAQARFEALPIRDLRSYAAGAAKIRDSLGGLFTAIGAALDRLGNTYTDPDLNQAFRDEPACRRLA